MAPYAIGHVFFLKFGGCFLNLRQVISENTVVEILLVNSDS